MLSQENGSSAWESISGNMLSCFLQSSLTISFHCFQTAHHDVRNNGVFKSCIFVVITERIANCVNACSKFLHIVQYFIFYNWLTTEADITDSSGKKTATMNDIGSLHNYLGLRFECDEDGTFQLHQNYIQKKLQEINLSEGRQSSEPLTHNINKYKK